MNRPAIPLFASLALALIVAACGGGSGTSDQSRGPTTDLPPGSPADRTAYSQIGKAPLPVSRPTPQVSYDGTAVSFDRTPGGHDAQSIVDYLHAIAAGRGPAAVPKDRLSNVLSTFPSPPTVHLAADTPAQFREVAAEAVANINRWLPYGKRIAIADDLPPLTPIDDIPERQIYLGFARSSDWPPQFKNKAGVVQTSRRYITPVPPDEARDAPKFTFSARIWVDPKASSPVDTTTHELLHALGFAGHISPDRFPDSIMHASRASAPRSLPAIDGETLLAVYTRFETGTHADNISQETLGPWATETMYIQGDVDAAGNPIAFGVSFRNGLGRPWAHGVKPDAVLADNTALSGSAEWNGTLLGITSAGQTAAGAARIGVELSTMTGTADFNDIETWSGPPGTKGTGAHWGDLALPHLGQRQLVPEHRRRFRRSPGHLHRQATPGRRREPSNGSTSPPLSAHCGTPDSGPFRTGRKCVSPGGGPLLPPPRLPPPLLRRDLERTAHPRPRVSRISRHPAFQMMIDLADSGQPVPLPDSGNAARDHDFKSDGSVEPPERTGIWRLSRSALHVQAAGSTRAYPWRDMVAVSGWKEGTGRSGD